ncbi:MAG: hypothetical protein NT077_02555, partial [Candidatus Taylorbacteria bacterium]|nr:hypothetical protein [Candidatus Taylorbacteria bacterium]
NLLGLYNHAYSLVNRIPDPEMANPARLDVFTIKIYEKTKPKIVNDCDVGRIDYEYARFKGGLCL